MAPRRLTLKKIVIFGALILVCLLLTGCQQADWLPTSGDYRFGMGWFDRALMQLMAEWEIPGGAFAVMKDGEILLARGYGYANVELGEVVQPDSLFRIASVSKPITAVAVLQLVEEGKLNLDSPAFQLLDDLQPLEGLGVDPRIDQITIRHLLEHAGGWDGNASFDPMFMSDEISQAMGTPAPADCPTIIGYMLGQPLDFDPGTQYAYSNFGYCVLGRVIEKVSGMAYEDYVKRYILEPIGVEHMRLGHSLLKDKHAGEVHYYGSEASPAQSVFPETTESTPWPYGGFYLEAMDSHGGWIASAVDLARFSYTLESTNPDALLDSDTRALMTARPDIPLWKEPSNYYALGWFVRPEGSGFHRWHGGSLPGTTAILYRRPNGLTWAALFNTRSDPPDDAFLVELITAMGLAAIMDKLVWGAVIVVFLIGSGILFFVQRRKRRQEEIRAIDR
jgi:N-acyl-D-amino-acid deacylase